MLFLDDDVNAVHNGGTYEDILPHCPTYISEQRRSRLDSPHSLGRCYN